MLKLDKKDYKLIEILDFKPKQTYTSIAKQLNLSKQSVEYRISKLEKEGIYKGFHPIINFSKLGFYYSRLMFGLRNIPEEKREEFTKFLKSLEAPFWIFKLSENYDIGFATLTKTLQEYKETRDYIFEKYGNYIQNPEEAVLTSLYGLTYSFSGELKKEINYLQKAPKKQIESINEIDFSILKALCERKKFSIIELAQELKLTSKVVSYRIKKMEKEDIIMAYRGNINYEKIGLIYLKVSINLNTFDREENEKLKQYLLSHKITLFYVEVIGVCDKIEVEVLLESINDLYKFIEELRNKFPSSIGSYRTITLREALKASYLPHKV